VIQKFQNKMARGEDYTIGAASYFDISIFFRLNFVTL